MKLEGIHEFIRKLDFINLSANKYILFPLYITYE